MYPLVLWLGPSFSVSLGLWTERLTCFLASSFASGGLPGPRLGSGPSPSESVGCRWALINRPLLRTDLDRSRHSCIFQNGSFPLPCQTQRGSLRFPVGKHTLHLRILLFYTSYDCYSLILPYFIIPWRYIQAIACIRISLPSMVKQCVWYSVLYLCAERCWK